MDTFETKTFYAGSMNCDKEIDDFLNFNPYAPERKPVSLYNRTVVGYVSADNHITITVRIWDSFKV